MLKNSLEYLSVPETAEFLGVSQSWLNQARLIGNGPTYLKVGRRVLYARADIVSWIESRKFSSTSAYFGSASH
jgi:predicted DNA-binding transcriptional regulator AlpA